jgi:alpha-L-arabinofuranosidase
MDFGYDEFLQFCESNNIEPDIVVSVGSSAKRAIELLKYCMADTNDEWGKKRALNGRIKPYKINYIEIGNEQWDYPEKYSQTYKRYYDSIKTVFPNLRLIYGGNHWEGDKDFETMKKFNGNNVDIYGYHPCVLTEKKAEIIEKDAFKTIIGASDWNSQIAKNYDKFFYANPDENIKYAISEWWTQWSNREDMMEDTSSYHLKFGLGLCNGGIGLSILKNSSIIELAIRTVGINFIKRGINSLTNKRALVCEPSYIALKMLSNHFGERVFPININTEKYSFYPNIKGLYYFENSLRVDAAATASKDTLFVAMINRYEEDSARVKINLGSSQSTDAIAYQLYSENMSDATTPEDPFKIRETQSKIFFNGYYTMPPHSLAVLAIPVTNYGNVDSTKTHFSDYYPNPVNDIMTIVVDNNDAFASELKLYDISGKLIYQKTFPQSKFIRPNLMDLEKGVYYAYLFYNGRVKSFSITKE